MQRLNTQMCSQNLNAMCPNECVSHGCCYEMNEFMYIEHVNYLSEMECWQHYLFQAAKQTNIKKS